MKFKFVAEAKVIGGVPQIEVKLFTIEKNGIADNSGRFTLLPEEFEVFKFLILEGASRYMEKEVAIEFDDKSKVKAYTEGK